MNTEEKKRYFHERIAERQRNSRSQTLAKDGEIFMFNIRREKLEQMEKASSDFNLGFRFEEIAYDIYGVELEAGTYYAVYAGMEGWWKYNPSMIPSKPTKII